MLRMPITNEVAVHPADPAGSGSRAAKSDDGEERAADGEAAGDEGERRERLDADLDEQVAAAPEEAEGGEDAARRCGIATSSVRRLRHWIRCDGSAPIGTT